MIFTERTIRVSNGTSSISSPIILYKGDKNIKIRFRIVDCPYTYSKNVDNIIETSEVSYAQLIIKTPNDGTPIFSDIAEPENGYVTFIITSEMIDEAQEVGKYTLQIRLLDDEQYGRITIPEVVDGIEVREPIAIEAVSTTNEVDVAVANYALTTAGTSEDTFDSQGNYNKTTWGTGDRITAQKLNKMETGIYEINKKVASGSAGGGEVDLTGYAKKTDLPTRTSQLTNDSGFITSVPSEYITETELNNKGYATTSQIPTVPTNVSEFTNDSHYATETFVTNKIAEAQLNGGSGTSQSTGLIDNSVKFQHLNETLRNKLFKYRDINCNKLSWTQKYVNGSLEIKYSGKSLLSECLNVERGEKLLAENGHEFKIVYYEGDTITSLSESYVTSIEFTQAAKIRIQVSRQDSAAMSLSEFLSKQNIIYSKFAISTGDNSDNLDKIHIITNTINDNYKPSGSDYIKFVDGSNKLDSLYSLWDNLMSEHSDYITKEVIGQDSTGLNINVYKLTPPSKKMWMNDDKFAMLKIIYISCLHGDEPNAPYSDFRFFKHLATGHASNDTLRMLYDNVEFVVCPIANPWGYNNNSRLNSNGVNLSRNFPTNWVAIEQGNDYSGATAASEIETQLIMQLIDDNSDAFFMVDRHGTTTFTQASKFGYASSNFKSDRKISYDLFRRLDSSFKDSFKFINSDEPANITRNILGVSLADAVGNLHNYANITKNMNGVLLELGSRRFGDSYPTGTLQDMQAMEVELIGSLLETVVLNNSFLLLNK